MRATFEGPFRAAPRKRMSRAFTAGDFEAGARALVERWSIDPAAMNASMTVRWVEETDPVRRNAAAGGYVAAEGHLVVPAPSGTLQNDETDERPGSTDHEDHEDHHEDHEDDAIEEEEEEDDAAAPRTVPPLGSHIRSYHVVYSKSYGCPVLLVRGVSCEPPGGRVMGHAETEASLVAAATRGAEGGAEEERRRRAVSLPIVDGELYGQYGQYGLTVFAPWEHPHGRGGGWVGVHPCETRSAMATLLAGEGEGTGSGSARYMSAWISFVAAAVADLPVPAHRMIS